MSRLLRHLPQIVFVTSGLLLLLGAGFLYGAFAQARDLFPVPQIRTLKETFTEILGSGDDILETRNLRYDDPVETRLPDRVAPGLLLVFGDIGNRQASVKVIERDGTVLHEWQPVWNEIWPPDQGTFPEGRRPVEGMILHGLDILPDASIVANFEHLSTFRMDVCGDIVWKHDNLGHHSVHAAEDGTLWVSAETYIPEGEPTGYPKHAAPLRSWTLQQLDARDGAVLTEIPVIEALLENGLAGLLYMSNIGNGAPVVSGDTLHLNDVESLSAEMAAGSPFEAGDLVVSLRNINTVLVLDPETREVRFRSTGGMTRQHDPDFMAGGRISVFDNQNHTQAGNRQPASRIIEIDPVSGAQTVVLDGGPGSDEPFYTEIMGTHDRLDNGNILVVPSGEGRVLEFTPEGSLAWRYDNRQGEGLNRRIYGAYVLPAEMDAAFFASRAAACRAPGAG